MFKVLTLLFFTGSCLFSYATEIPLELFARGDKLREVKLSPDGKHLAVTTPQEGRTSLVILNRKTMQPTFAYRFGTGEHVTTFYWVNNERLIFKRNKIEGDQEEAKDFGQVYAGNIDGTQAYPIFGYQVSDSTTGTHLGNKEFVSRAWGYIVHLLPDDPEHIIIRAEEWAKNDSDKSQKLIKVNVYSRKQELITRTPFGNMDIVINGQGEPVIATGIDFHGNQKVYLFEETGWNLVNKKNPLYQFTPIAIDRNGEKLYLKGRENTEAIYKYDLKSETYELIFNDKKSDIFDYIIHPQTWNIVGAVTAPDKFEYHYLDSNSDYESLHSELVDAFGDALLEVVSVTSDMNEFIIKVITDRTPGDFFLFNRKSKSADYLLSSREWIQPDRMTAVTPIDFKARDGEQITGYLTLPKNTEKAPLVTLVHGGPYGKRDYWLFDPDVQMLASRGFAVLQVNFRGSGGYGRQFEEVAYKKRSTLIQHDIIDGTKWALELPNIVSEKACIMGWSFGGYSAVMSALIEPDLFQCSIAAAGVYDAEQQEDTADYAKVHSLKFKTAEVYGDSEALLKKESPIEYIEKLKAPLLIVHGGRDRRVPPSQALLLRDRLNELNKPYEWLFKKKEGHAFFDLENRVEFYQRSLEFLDKHLK